MSRLKVPVICIVIGEGSSGGALAIGVGDRILMLENAVYSVLSPEGFASILWKDSSRASEAAEIMKMTATDLKELNLIDKIIKEPKDGAHSNTKEMAGIVKDEIIKNLNELVKIDLEVLLEERYNKFRAM